MKSCSFQFTFSNSFHFDLTLLGSEHPSPPLMSAIAIYVELSTKIALLNMQAEWEALEIADHDWAMKNVEEELMREYKQNEVFYRKDKIV